MNRLASYTVRDLLPSDERLRVVFLLESPYVNEVLHGHPLAGESGKTVARWLVGNIEEFRDWDGEEPIGCQLKKWMEDHSRVGLMNCSLRPMDESVYSCSRGSIDRTVVSALGLIRVGIRARVLASTAAVRLENRLVDGLRTRLMRLPDSTLIVPCGVFARRMVHECLSVAARGRLQREPIVYDGMVPHPSRQSWSATRYRTHMEQLKERLESRGILDGE